MVMDEKGRNGGNWHLAQQLTYHVIIQKTTNHRTRNQIINNKPHSLVHNNNYHTDIGGIFISLISIPLPNYNNLQFINK